jgi:hypothetical protein
MLETSRVCIGAFWPFAGSAGPRVLAGVVASLLAACTTPEVVKAPEPAPVVKAPEPAPPDATAGEQEARALLAQAETDIQRARAKRALWLKAWESLVLARQSAAARDNASTVVHAKRASELAQLGLEQLAYPAVN